jgi:transposase-like protein
MEQEVLFMSGKKGMSRYPVEVKLEAVRLFYEEGKTCAEITNALEIRDPQRVKNWLWAYRQAGEVGFNRPIGRPPKQAENEQTELKRLRMENTLLKKFHTELRTKMLAKRNIGSCITTEKNTK